LGPIGRGTGFSAPSIIASRSGIGTRPPSQEVSISFKGTPHSLQLYGTAKCFAIPLPHVW
jgi:hypothetical protein